MLHNFVFPVKNGSSMNTYHIKYNNRYILLFSNKFPVSVLINLSSCEYYTFLKPLFVNYDLYASLLINNSNNTLKKIISGLFWL